MILQNKKHYLAIKFSDDEDFTGTAYLKNKNDFSKYQSQDYNIYYILNDFFRRRTQKDLIWFKYIWIDLDYYPEKKKTVIEVLNLFTSHNIPVYKINETFKGYHVFIKLSWDLYNLSVPNYIDLYEKINLLSWGDPNMNSITGVLKVEDTYDIKAKRNFKIKTKYFNNSNILQTEHVKKLIGDIFIDENRAEDYRLKKEKRNRNIDFINNLDSKDFLQHFNKYFPERKIPITRNLWNTDGVKLFLYKGKYNIKDFSQKGRGGNYNFLFKVLFLHATEAEFSKLLFLLKKEYNYSFNYTLKKEAYFNNMLTLDFFSLLEYENISLEEKAYMYKLLRALYYLNLKSSKITRKDICNIFKIKADNTQFKKIDTAIKKLSSLKYPLGLLAARKQETLIQVEEEEGLRKEKIYKISFPELTYIAVWWNIDVFEIVKKNTKMSFFIFKILDNISLYGSYRYSIDYSIRLLDSETLSDNTKKNTLRRILLNLKKYDLIKKYTLKGNTLEVI